jgi:hypothetical protein
LLASMADFIHQNLAQWKWFAMSLNEQLGNVGSEIGGAANWKKKGDNERVAHALERGLELLDITIADNRWAGPMRKELCRVRELVKDTFYGDNQYKDSPEALEKYFFQYAVAARANK